jgi:hypothetical protein
MNLTSLTNVADKHNKIGCLLNVLSALAVCDCCNGSDSARGCMVLANGHHEVTVRTLDKPKKVYLTTNSDSANTPVCQGAIDMVGCTLTDDGFVLYADIRSNTAQVCWAVES